MRNIRGLGVINIIFLLAGTALAEEATCGKRATVIDCLANNYSEQPAGLGLTSDGKVFFIWKGLL